MAAAHVLHYGVGVPVRKVPSVLKVLTGLELTQGAITQDALRPARGAVGGVYQRLRASVIDSRAVHTDDTGWRVGGELAFLMAFETEETALYCKLSHAAWLTNQIPVPMITHFDAKISSIRGAITHILIGPKPLVTGVVLRHAVMNTRWWPPLLHYQLQQIIHGSFLFLIGNLLL